MAHTDKYLDCVNNWWGGFVGKETCEAGYLVCKGKECDRYTPEKKQKKQTNADKYFRNATDRQIADFIHEVGRDMLCPPRCCPEYKDCSKCWLDWLKQEVEGDG